MFRILPNPTFVELSKTRNCGLGLGTLKTWGRIAIMVIFKGTMILTTGIMTLECDHLDINISSRGLLRTNLHSGMIIRKIITNSGKRLNPSLQAGLGFGAYTPKPSTPKPGRKSCNSYVSCCSSWPRSIA